MVQELMAGYRRRRKAGVRDRCVCVCVCKIRAAAPGVRAEAVRGYSVGIGIERVRRLFRGML